MSDTVESFYVSGNFAPVAEEVAAFDLPVTGSVPPELLGRYLRNGPNPIGPVDPRPTTGSSAPGWCTACACATARPSGTATGTSRGDEVAETQGLEPLPGPRHPLFGGGSPNTNVIGHAGATWALVEAGTRPVELSYELESIRYLDFDGAWPGSFSAHPKLDPITGELHLMGYYWEWDHVKYVVVRPDGTIRKVVEVPVPGRIMLHDVGITDSSILIFDLPVTFQLDALGEGSPFPYRWDPDYHASRRRAAAGGHGRRRQVGRRRPVLRVPPDERLRPAGRADRDRRGPASADVRHRLQRPGRGRPDARPLDDRPDRRQGAARSVSTTAARSSPASTSDWSASRTATATAPPSRPVRSTHGDLLKHDLERGTTHGPQLRCRANDGRGRVRPPRRRRGGGRRLGDVPRATTRAPIAATS